MAYKDLMYALRPCELASSRGMALLVANLLSIFDTFQTIESLEGSHKEQFKYKPTVVSQNINNREL